MKTLNLVIIVALIVGLSSCGGGNHPEQPTSQAELDAGQQARANEANFSSKHVQGEWELIEVEGADIEMYKGTVLKFDSDAMYQTQNEEKQMGIFFIKDNLLHWSPQGQDKITYDASLVDGNLHLVSADGQIFIYKKI